MAFEVAIQELAVLVGSNEFREKQTSFFDRYCDEFDGDAEENKLSYTAIHKEYVETIEKEIEANLGKEKLDVLEQGVEEYVKSGHGFETEAAAEAIDILGSLADFEAFKAAMLAKKAAKHASGMEIGTVKGVLKIDDVMDRTAGLLNAADEADGWVLRVNEPNCIFYTKPEAGGSTYLRYTIQVELPPEKAYDMFTDWSERSVAWREKMANITKVKDYGPNDQVVQYELTVPWAVRYVMAIPTSMAVRVARRENWPESGDFAYACVPFDLEQNIAVEEMGMLKIKTGVITAHPEDPNMSLLRGMDLVNLGMIPSWGLGYLLKHMSLPAIASMTSAFKHATSA
eukprot:TRINITY_DN3505_c0_g1_i1.p1 TRINITY_DN3505_c0_g1~~TRINITY_DN3505_c0_g1_i1.p1  ORF type:complete len:349 (+),score=77.68 TRINITY_DN3505_c0_g1_i1:22-1047(+)